MFSPLFYSHLYFTTLNPEEQEYCIHRSSLDGSDEIKVIKDYNPDAVVLESLTIEGMCHSSGNQLILIITRHPHLHRL